jgi:hypothetical protein
MLLVLAESVGKGRGRAMGTKLGLCERLGASYSQTRAALAQLEAQRLLGIEKVGEGFVLTPLHPAILQLLEERGARASGRANRERRKTGTGSRRAVDVDLELAKTERRKTGTGSASNARDTITAQEKKPPKPPARGGEGALLACGPFPARPRLPESRRLDAKRRAELEEQAERLEVPKPWKLRALLAFVFDTVPAGDAERIAGGAWEADRSPVALVSFRLRRYLEASKPTGRWYRSTLEPETPPEERATPEEAKRILRAALAATPTTKAKEA